MKTHKQNKELTPYQIKLIKAMKHYGESVMITGEAAIVDGINEKREAPEALVKVKNMFPKADTIN